MRITAIEFAGTPKTTTRDGEGLARAFARIERKPYSDEIEVTILRPGGETTHRLPATTTNAGTIRHGDRESVDQWPIERVEAHAPLWEMAERLQETLDGCAGTNSMVHDYYRELERLAD